MGNRRPSQEHQEAVSRRLAQLSAELDGVRGRRLDNATSPRQAPPDEFAMPLTHTRVRRAAPAPQLQGEPPPGPAQPDPPPLVQSPGRHASRRPGRSIADALPPTLRGRVALGSAQVALVAALVAVGLGVTCWWVIRGDAHEVASPALSSTSGALATPALPVASESTSTSASASAGAGGTVTVDVTGKVRNPGIAVLDSGARVIDALEAAGGARPGVDLTALNLARMLIDGEQIVVGVAAPAGVAGAAAPVPPEATSGPLVNLNTADQTLLETLPDVGPVTAEAIIAWRTEHGGFTAIDELLEVDGIGDATLAELTPHVTV